MKPNFFIVGTPKAGTTSLYEYLQEHPDVYMSPIKETNYFSFEEIEKQGLFYNEEHINSIDKYLAQFADVRTEKAIGEASVSYLFYDSVPDKIKNFNPNSKIIIVLRNPIERGFSHYLMDKRIGFVKNKYDDIVHKKSQNKKAFLYYQQYVALGLYYEQLQRYFSVFDKKQILVLLYEDINQHIEKVVHNLYSFLEVDTSFQPDLNKKHNTFIAPKNPVIQHLYKFKMVRNVAKRVFNNSFQHSIKNNFFSKEKKPVLDNGLKKDLIEIYRSDIDKTAELINRDLRSWYS